MIASLPVPGLITKYIRNTQREKMKRVTISHPYSRDMTGSHLLPRPMLVYSSLPKVSPAFAYYANTDLCFLVMNVIRMVKLFGWEPRIMAQVNEKREEELVSVRRARLLTMWNNFFKYVLSYIPLPKTDGC